MQWRRFAAAIQHTAAPPRSPSVTENEEEFSSCSCSPSDNSDEENCTSSSSGASHDDTSSSSSSHIPSRHSSCSEERQPSIPASVAASTAPSAAFSANHTQRPGADGSHAPAWLLAKQADPDPDALSIAKAEGFRQLSVSDSRERSVPSAVTAPAHGAVGATSPPAGVSVGGVCGSNTGSVTGTAADALTGLGNFLLAIGSRDSPRQADNVQSSPNSVSSSSNSICQTQRQMTPGAAVFQSPRAAPSPGPSTHPASLTAATTAATVAAEATAAPRSAAVADSGSEVRSALGGTRLPSLSSDCLHLRSGTVPHIEAVDSMGSSCSTGSPSRFFRWHVGSCAAWAAGGTGRIGSSGSCSRGPGNSHCEMMQALKRQADLKASVDKAVLLFNKEGLQAALQWLSERKLIDSQDPAAVARFLYDTPGLDKKKVGEVLGGCSAFSLLVLQSFASLCDYRGLSIDEALRQFFSKFRPPGEAQQVYRLLYRFASLYVKDNQERGLDLDTVHFLAYAILMLHTDSGEA